MAKKKVSPSGKRAGRQGVVSEDAKSPLHPREPETRSRPPGAPGPSKAPTRKAKSGKRPAKRKTSSLRSRRERRRG